MTTVDTSSETPDVNTIVAERVRALRAGRAMTLDALAARSRVSRSMISLVERGESSPTAVVLEKIAAGLGVPLVSLFQAGGPPASPVSRPSERRTWRDPGSGYLRRNISPPGFPSPIQITEVELPAGARVAYETGVREVPVHEQIWVQDGAVAVTVGTATHALDAGDCLALQLSEATAFHNPGDAPARYIVVVVS